MTELSEAQIRNKVICPRCDNHYKDNMFEKMHIEAQGYCQRCRAELSGNYADGQGNALADLIAAARDLRQASADYANGSDKGEIHYADAVHESVDLLIDALDNYEGGGKR